MKRKHKRPFVSLELSGAGFVQLLGEVHSQPCFSSQMSHSHIGFMLTSGNQALATTSSVVNLVILNLL